MSIDHLWENFKIKILASFWPPFKIQYIILDIKQVHILKDNTQLNTFSQKNTQIPGQLEDCGHKKINAR